MSEISNNLSAPLNETSIQGNPLSGKQEFAASIISGIAALATGITSAVVARRQQKRANKYNQEQMAQQYALEREQQDYQNDYNSPANQRARMVAAGFNPNEGITNYQSADAAAPQPIPFAEANYDNALNLIGSSMNEFRNSASWIEQLQYQRLQNQEKGLQNALLANSLKQSELGLSQMTALDYNKRTQIFNYLMKSGVSKEQAARIAYSQLMNPILGISQEDMPDYFDQSLGTIERKLLLGSLSQQGLLSKMQDLNYQFLSDTYDSRKQSLDLTNRIGRANARYLEETLGDRKEAIKLGNRATETNIWNTENNAAYIARKNQFVTEANRYIDEHYKDSPKIRFALKLAANEVIQNGVPDSLNPILWVKDIIQLYTGGLAKVGGKLLEATTTKSGNSTTTSYKYSK